jgi:hypothetical protein
MLTNRSKSSRLGRLLAGGAAVVLATAGVAFVGVLPASASTATGVTFSTIANVVAGATIPDFTVTFSNGNATDHIAISGCGVAGTLSVPASGSVATFHGIVADTAGSCTLTATDTDSTGSGTSNSFTVSPAAASKLGFTTQPPGTSGANTAVTSFVVKTEDQYGNPVNTGTDTVNISSSCTLGGTQSAAEVAGVATFSALTINKVGTCYLTATDATNTGIAPATSSAIVVSGGTPEKVAFSVAPPATVAATGTIVTAFKAAVEDANGNVDTTGLGSSDSITLSSTCLAAPVTATAVAGVATFATVEFASTGNCTLTATDASRTLVAGTATTSVGQAQAAVTVTSKNGYLDAPLTLAATGGSGTGAVTYTVTNGTATGCAITSGTLKATKAGTCLVTATKAAVAPYTVGVSVATTVTISSAPKAIRLAGAIRRGRTVAVTVTGYNFSGRPRVTSNVAGFTGLVTRDSGRSLTIRVTVKGTSARAGVKTLTLAFANGKHASVKYSLH